jgi:hypothetical protein
MRVAGTGVGVGVGKGVGVEVGTGEGVCVSPKMGLSKIEDVIVQPVMDIKKKIPNNR